MSFHGYPCWFELSTGDLDAAKGFYEALFGWMIGPSVMPDFDYRLAASGKEMVAGMMPLSMLPPGTPPNWMIYIAVDDCDETAAQTAALGGTVLKEPADIPGTGRFAVLLDPQGACFGILQPAPMENPPEGGAFDQQKSGHGNWIELMTGDPKAALGFYGMLFGWVEDAAMPMGEMGSYHIFSRAGAQIGGMMGLGTAPYPNWLPYFGVDDIPATIDTAEARGATLVHGPAEVPGPALIVVFRDPQGAHFAVVGPKP